MITHEACFLLRIEINLRQHTYISSRHGSERNRRKTKTTVKNAKANKFLAKLAQIPYTAGESVSFKAIRQLSQPQALSISIRFHK